MVGVQCFQLGKNLGGHGLGIAGIGVHPADAPVATLNQRMSTLRAQIYEMCEEKGEWAAMPQARSQAMHYMKGLRGAAALRRYCSMLEHFTDVDTLIDAVYKLQ